jgi:DNA polymerase elongation subunit (family B)
MENIILFRDENASRDGGEGIAGGWVKDPIVGMNKWVCVYDFMSLYPITQLQFFIAPETFVGVKPDEEEDYCFNGAQRIKIDKSKHVVCTNGVVFEKRYSPTLKMLDDVFKERKKNKNIMMDKKEELKKVQDEIKKLESELI